MLSGFTYVFSIYSALSDVMGAASSVGQPGGASSWIEVGVKEPVAIDKSNVDFFLNDQRARKYFDQFAESECGNKVAGFVPVIGIYREVQQMLDDNYGKDSMRYKILKEGQGDFQDWMEKEMISSFINKKVNEEDQDVELFECLGKLQTEMLGMIMVGQFPRFLKSKFYVSYLAECAEDSGNSKLSGKDDENG